MFHVEHFVDARARSVPWSWLPAHALRSGYLPVATSIRREKRGARIIGATGAVFADVPCVKCGGLGIPSSLERPLDQIVPRGTILAKSLFCRDSREQDAIL